MLKRGLVVKQGKLVVTQELLVVIRLKLDVFAGLSVVTNPVRISASVPLRI